MPKWLEVGFVSGKIVAKNPLFWFLGGLLLLCVAAELFIANKILNFGLGYIVSQVIILGTFSLVVTFFWGMVLNKIQECPKIRLSEWNKVILRVYLVSGFSLVLLRIIKSSQIDWAFFTLVFGFIVTTALGILLSVIVFRLQLLKSWLIVWDLWFKRSIIPALFTVVVMFLHSLSFLIARLELFTLVSGEYFTVLWSFDNIGILCILFVLLSVIFAWINVFMVLGFLEIFKTKKTDKPVKELYNFAVTTEQP